MSPADIDFSAPPCAVNNGALWLIVRMRDAQACLDFAPAPSKARVYPDAPRFLNAGRLRTI